jgi:DtxR family transcriptional regulator, Mn-dependent transcriptional regulator
MRSASIEDYLKYVYKLRESEKKVNTTGLAKVLNVSPASVSEMVSKLSKEGLIVNTPYRGFKLSKKGENIAINLLRKHRMLEVFLKDTLNYRWDEVHPEAERLEHSVSDEFINKLEKYLGHPKFDPHGDPIPDKKGKVCNNKNFCLNNAAAEKYYIITKVPDDSQEILRYFSDAGITLNSRIFVNKKLSVDGSVLITFKKRTHLLSQKISGKIFVEIVK